MSFILHLETSTRMCSVALSEHGKLLALKELGGAYTHAENLTLFIQDVLTASGNHLKAVDAIAVSIGPGSYTGLRIGLSTAKGLCYALGKPLIAVSTLHALALGLKNKEHYGDALLCPMLDARRMEVYCALYTIQGEEIQGPEAKIIDETSFRDLLEKRKIVFFGDGSDKCKPLISHPNAVFAGNLVPSAQFMIPLAEKAFGEQHFADLAYSEPLYLKEFYTGQKPE